MVNNKILWAAIIILFLASGYSTYNDYIQNEKIQKLFGQINAPNPISSGSGTPQLGSVFLAVERIIPVVSVTNDGEGEIDNLTVKLIPGNNNVLINTNPFLDESLQYSMNKAVAVAKLKLNSGFDRDYIFDYKAGNAQLIGGESAGVAATVAVIAALQNKTIKKDAVITGTIESDGTIGEIGGIIEKAKAVSEAGYKRFFVPKGQSKVTYYERQISKESTHNGFAILNTKYVQKTLDLKDVAKKEWNLEIIETSTIDDALRQMTY